jgi:hypothetical protein
VHRECTQKAAKLKQLKFLFLIDKSILLRISSKCIKHALKEKEDSNELVEISIIKDSKKSPTEEDNLYFKSQNLKQMIRSIA